MVRIPNGGNIVIDRCEAMTVIDVNSASSGIKGKPERSYTEINLAACETIAAQIRLRNLAGIIMIEFIDMKEEIETK
jgi:ribonuclease G